MMPLVIGGVTAISKKWGNQIGGMLASLPWVAGPIILFFYLEQGVDFTVNSIEGVMIGMFGTYAFTFMYIFSSIKNKWYISLLLSYLCFIGVVLILKNLEGKLSLNTWFLLILITNIIGFRLFPNYKSKEIHEKKLKNDLVLRMIVITFFVILITYLAKILGPYWSGILTPFPIVTAILAAFTHYTQGAYGTSIILRGMLTGFIGFATFLFLQAKLLPHFPIAISFAIGLVINLLVNISMQYLGKKVLYKV